MEFKVLGPVEATADGCRLSVRGPKQRALLALLLLRANEPVGNDLLISALWDGSPPRDAEAVLRIHVSNLRRALDREAGDRLVTRARGYELRVEPGELDLERFRRLAQSGADALAASDPASAAEALRTALELWRGEPLADLGDEPFVHAERARLAELRTEAVMRWAEAELALGRPEAVIAELEALIEAEPYQERVRAQLMLALYRAGRQADALELYKQTRSRFADELGIEPTRELRALERAILSQDRSLDQPPPPTSPSRTRPRRLLVVPLVVTAAVSALVLAVILAFAPGEAPKPTSIAANAVGLIDPRTNRLVAQVQVGRNPVAIAAHGRNVWVANSRDETISQIDATHRRTIRTIGLGARPTDIAAAARGIWVATSGYDRELIEILPNGDVSSVALPAGDRRGRGGHLALGRSDVWLGDGDSSLFRFRTRPARFSPPIDVPNGFGVPGGKIATAGGAVWVADPHGSELSRVDPRLQSVTAAVSIGPDPDAGGGAAGLAAGHGSVWVVAPNTRKLWRVDLGTSSMSAVIELGHNPVAVAVAGGAVWVATSDGYVLRIDPSRNRIAAQIEVGGSPTALAAGDGTIWVAVS